MFHNFIYQPLVLEAGGVTLGMLMIVPHPAVVCLDASQSVRSQDAFYSWRELCGGVVGELEATDSSKLCHEIHSFKTGAVIWHSLE